MGVDAQHPPPQTDLKTNAMQALVELLQNLLQSHFCAHVAAFLALVSYCDLA